MIGIKRSTLILLFLGSFNTAFAQLPPEILADRHLIQAEQLHAEGDRAGAILVMKKIIAMQQEHNFKLADEFHFKYARVAMSADSIKIALDAANKYLSTTGRTGEFYKEALALSLNASEELDVPEINTGETCTGKPVGSSCWTAVSNHPDCYVWNPYLQRDAEATWSGRCSRGVGRGEGTISWTYAPQKERTYTETGRYTEDMYDGLAETGRLKKGKHHSRWIRRFPDGTVQEGPYVRGKKDGLWVERVAKTNRPYIAKISYSDGRRHGMFEAEVTACPDSSLTFTVSGEFVRGKKQGRWKNEWVRYRYDSGRYINGLRQGHWIKRGISCKHTFLYELDKGEYIDGKKHGEWDEYDFSDRRSSGTYMDGEKHGKWLERDASGYEEGHYLVGKRSGEWYKYDFGGNNERGTYFKGNREGIWYYWDDDERKCRSREYRLGSEVGRRRKAKKKMCGE